MRGREQGWIDACQDFGLEKTAFRAAALGRFARMAAREMPDNVRAFARTVPGKAREMAREAPGATKRFLVGDPRAFYRQFQDGTLMEREKGLLRGALLPKSRAGQLFLYGLPALTAADQLSEDTANRGANAGSMLGGAVGAAAGLPLGLVGMMGGGALGGALGGTVGSVFDRKPKPFVFQELGG